MDNTSGMNIYFLRQVLVTFYKLQKTFGLFVSFIL